jgi:hypothetical protein
MNEDRKNRVVVPDTPRELLKNRLDDSETASRDP